MNEWRDSKVGGVRGTGISVDVLARSPRRAHIMHYMMWLGLPI